MSEQGRNERKCALLANINSAKSHKVKAYIQYGNYCRETKQTKNGIDRQDKQGL